MNESLMVANVYAAYTATANKSDRSVSELSKMLKDDTYSQSNKESNPALNMDTVIISKEALEKLSSVSLATDSK